MLVPTISLEQCKQLLGPNPWLTLAIGTIAGWFFSRGMSYLSKPNIEIVIAPDAFLQQGSANEVKFLHTKVNNKKRNFLMRFLFGNSTANYIRAWVSFEDPITNVEYFKINGRWSTTKEPVDYSTNRPDIGLILVPSRETLPAGESSDISIAVKRKGETSAYAFNNESYLYPDWKNPDFELNDREYSLVVKVAAEGYEWKRRFNLINPGISTSRFKLN